MLAHDKFRGWRAPKVLTFLLPDFIENIVSIININGWTWTSDLLGPLKRTNESCRIYSEACLELCREMNVKAIDLWSAVQQRHDWSDVCFTWVYIPIALSLVYMMEKYKSRNDSFDEVLFDRDGIHLSHEGNKIVAKEILKVLREADWEPSLHWNSMPTEFAEDSLYDPNGVDEESIINVSNGNFQGNSQSK